MEIRILGPLEVSVQGRPREVPAGKAGLVLAALVTHPNQVVSVDRLLEFLWHGRPPESAGNTLQTYISRLRRSLEPDRAPREPSRLLVTRSPGYLLAVTPDQVDASRFEQLVEQGHRLLDDDPQAAAGRLRAALSLWRGEPLADFTFEPFAQAEIARLAELRLSAIEDRIDADLVLGNHAAVCGDLARLVREHPLRERLSGQLMVALYRSGRQADALRVCAELRTTLVEQLGIDPSPALARLEQGILRQELDLDLLWRGAHQASTGSPAPPPQGPVDDALVAARSAAERSRWPEAVDLFRVADGRGDGLGGDDLDAYAEAAFWLGRPDEAHLARQRAHAVLLAHDQPRRAAMVATVLSVNYGARRRIAVAEGWFRRAERLLMDQAECPEHGFLAWARAMHSIAAGDLDVALSAARHAFDVGRRFAVPDLQALGLVHQGYVLVRRGEATEGLALIDEAMTWALPGQLAPTSAALVFCRTIDTCYVLGDYRRAAEWMEAIADCFSRTGVQAFPGDCEAHRVAMLVGLGAWSEGERRARAAMAAMEPMDLTHVGLALAEIGKIRLHRGDLDAAEEALTRAAELGATSHPALALLRLARGDIPRAAASIEVALAETARSSLDRGRLLPAQVEIALAGNDIDTARSAVAELIDVAGAYAQPAWAATADYARGAVTLADGDPTTAANLLRRAVASWREASAPYPAARARLLLGEALYEQGRRDHALIEIEAACVSFEALGARLDLERAVQTAARIRQGIGEPRRMAK
jgi:DNA-binding SARP family transcriptional activator